jgi:alkanesulfonate monooxygenase
MQYILESATAAENLGFDSILMPVSPRCVDPFIVAAFLAQNTTNLGLLVAIRPGMWNPVQVARSIASLCMIAPGRIAVNIVRGKSTENIAEGDNLGIEFHSARQLEFCQILSQLWKAGKANVSGNYYRVDCHMPTGIKPEAEPELFISGHTHAAMELASLYGSHVLWFGACLVSINELVNLSRTISERNAKPLRCGMGINIIARSTREEARIRASEYISRVNERSLCRFGEYYRANPLIDGMHIMDLEKRGYWADDILWYGLARGKTGPIASLVGSYDDVANRLIEYSELGVSYFVLTGEPNVEEVRIIGENVLPLIRSRT